MESIAMNEVAELFSMKGRVALVTGAASGMGERFAQVLARAGAKVVCAARRKDRLETLAEKIRARGGQAVPVAVDIGDADSIRAGFDAAEEAFGTVDVLVNCAGQLLFATVPQMPDEGWNNVMNVNLNGTMRMTREFSQRLIAAKKPGRIVNITSITGMGVMSQLAAYGVVKAALNHLTRYTATDLLAHGIRCNAIAPGYFHSEMSRDVFATEAGKAIQANLPFGRAGNVEELDGALLLLASDAGSFINGAVLPVDAGHHIQLT
jgi:NAD(P)-dependent dehydrogenase (short-subunit alcohol dehydrogenase family)